MTNLYEIKETYNGVRVYEIPANSEEEAIAILGKTPGDEYLLYDDGYDYEIAGIDLMAEGVELDVDSERDPWA